MSFDVRFTPEAEETFSAVIDQLQQKWGDKFVTKFKEKVKLSVKNLSVNPYLYPVAEDNTQIRKCVLHKNCSLLYKIYDNGTVLVICFWDNRQEPLILS